VDAQHKAELAEQQAKLDKAMKDLAEQNEAVKNLEGAVANAKTDGEKKAAEAALLAAKEEQKKKAGTVSSFKGPASPGVSPGVKPAKPCNCQPGDPLCSCL
jgi:colicin import membrane protein